MQVSANIKRRAGFTLTEVLVSIVIAGIGLTGTISAYVLSAKRAEWAVCSGAAQNLAMQRLNQTRAAKWDNSANPPIDQLKSANFPPFQQRLEIPETRSGSVIASVKTTISTISTAPPMRLVQVDCTWELGESKTFTNSVVAIRSPD